MNFGSEKLGRFVVTLLMASGLLLPSLFAMNLGAQAPMALVTAFLSLLFLSSISRSTKTAIVGAGAALIAITAWFILTPGPNGALRTLLNSIFAISLELAGQTAVLPLYALPASLLFAVVFALLSFALCKRNAGFYSALTVGLVVLTVLWITGRQDFLLYFLPAVAALVILYAGNVHEELPVRRVLPISLVLVALAYLLVPQSGVVSPTLQKTAQEIRQTVFDYLFFTEPRNVFTLAAEGYYPNGPTQLGGTANPTNHAVMEVITDRHVYLRGSIKDEYTGRTWLDSTGGKRYLYISPRYLSLRESLFDTHLPTGEYASSSMMNEKSITVKMVSNSASTLFLPQRVRSIEMLSEGMVPYFNNATEVFITRDLAVGDTYRVSSPMLVAGDAGLGTFLQGTQEDSQPQSTEIYQRYTVLPEHMEQGIYDMANRIVGSNTTPYDKAMAIQTYLSRYYKYTLEPQPMDGNVDFVSYFLLRGKEGYCTYFASAMTVLCRMVGLPSRYVEGYVAWPDAAGVAYVTGMDAHAWTEIYFNGYGWLTFDATPLRQHDNPPDEPTPPVGSDNPEPSPSPSPSPSPNPSPDPEEAPPDPNEDDQELPTPQPPSAEDAPDEPPENKEPPRFDWLWWVLGLVLVGLCALRLYLVIPKNLAKRQKTDKKAYYVWIQAIYDVIYLMKIKKLPGETLIGYAERLDAAHVLSAPITPVAQVLSHLQYSTHPVEKEYVELACDTYKHIEKGMKPFAKWHLMLYRAVTPQKRADYAKRLS